MKPTKKKTLAARIGPLQDPEPKGPSGAALAGCAFCGVCVASMGGGHWLCESCYGNICTAYGPHSQALRDAWYRIATAKAQTEENEGYVTTLWPHPPDASKEAMALWSRLAEAIRWDEDVDKTKAHPETILTDALARLNLRINELEKKLEATHGQT